MPTNKNRVMFLCDDETKNDLQRWAAQERRSVSNLVEKIVLDAVADWKQQQPPAPTPQPEPEPPELEEEKEDYTPPRRRSGTPPRRRKPNQ